MILSRRAYAAHRKRKGLPGGTDGAVRRAIKDGRLSKRVLTPDGRIKSAKAADAEWLASTKADMVPLGGPTAPKMRRSPTAPSPTKIVAAEADSPTGPQVNDLAVARARREAAQARMAELELARQEGELVLAKDVEARLADVFLRCRTKLLGVPTRAREQDPTLTDQQIKLVDELIHEACEELAGDQS